MAYGTMLVDTVQSSVAGTPPVFKDSGGTEVGQLCKAWCNFNGTSAGPIAPRASYNVSSITKNGTGDFTINFTAGALSDTNYSALATSGGVNNAFMIRSYEDGTARSTTTWRIGTIAVGSNAVIDPPYVSIAVFR